MKSMIKNVVGRGAIAVLLGFAMMFSCSVMALGDLSQTSNTRATVSFTDGDLEIGGGNVGGSGLNFFFGEHPIPIVRASYPAENDNAGLPLNHVLPVEDSRYNSGDWHIMVALTSFVDTPATPTSSFDAVIRLENAVTANANAAVGTAGLTVENSVFVASGASAVLVMYADNTLPRGLFTATWTNDDVVLDISDAEVMKIGPSAYEATLTWTLNLGPF